MIYKPQTPLTSFIVMLLHIITRRAEIDGAVTLLIGRFENANEALTFTDCKPTHGPQRTPTTPKTAARHPLQYKGKASKHFLLVFLLLSSGFCISGKEKYTEKPDLCGNCLFQSVEKKNI